MEIEEIVARFESGTASGEIVKTQTTYLDFATHFHNGSLIEQNKFRVHFHRKYEFCLERGGFECLQLLDKHPLLLDYTEPTVRVHLESAVDDKILFREVLEQTLNQIFDKRRSFDDYLLMPLDEFLKKDYGVLMEVPLSFAEALERAAGQIGVRLKLGQSWSKLRVNWQKHVPQILLFDERYVIAESFRAEILE